MSSNRCKIKPDKGIWLIQQRFENITLNKINKLHFWVATKQRYKHLYTAEKRLNDLQHQVLGVLKKVYSLYIPRYFILCDFMEYPDYVKENAFC